MSSRLLLLPAALALLAGCETVDPVSGSVDPSDDDCLLTERLRAASELVGVVARDHVILAASGYYSFVEAGRWRR